MASRSDTPDNPYIAARQEWTERYGSYVKAANAYRTTTTPVRRIQVDHLDDGQTGLRVNFPTDEAVSGQVAVTAKDFSGTAEAYTAQVDGQELNLHPSLELGAFFTFTVAFLGCGTGTEAETFDAVGPATVAAGGAASAWAAGTPIAPKNIVAEQARLTIVLRNMSPLLVLRGRSDPATPHRDCRESEKELKHSQLQCKFLRFLTRRIQVPAGEPDPARSAGSVVVTNEPRAATLDV